MRTDVTPIYGRPAQELVAEWKHEIGEAGDMLKFLRNRLSSLEDEERAECRAIIAIVGRQRRDLRARCEMYGQSTAIMVQAVELPVVGVISAEGAA